MIALGSAPARRDPAAELPGSDSPGAGLAAIRRRVGIVRKARGLPAVVIAEDAVIDPSQQSTSAKSSCGMIGILYCACSGALFHNYGLP